MYIFISIIFSFSRNFIKEEWYKAIKKRIDWCNLLNAINFKATKEGIGGGGGRVGKRGVCVVGGGRQYAWVSILCAGKRLARCLTRLEEITIEGEFQRQFPVMADIVEYIEYVNFPAIPLIYSSFSFTLFYFYFYLNIFLQGRLGEKRPCF